jgi:hypothetical protein
VVPERPLVPHCLLLVQAIARAWRWQRMLDEGVYTIVSAVGDAENISKS